VEGERREYDFSICFKFEEILEVEGTVMVGMLPKKY